MSSEWSYVHNPRNMTSTYKTVIDLLKEEVALNPDRECMVYRGFDGFRDCLTYKDLNSRATFLAKVLVSKGVKKGEKVALLGPNTLQKAIAEIGIIIAGAIVVHLTMNLADARDVLEIFTLANCRLLLVEPGRNQIDVEPMFRLLNTFAQRSNQKADEIEYPLVMFLRSMNNIPSHLYISGIPHMKIAIDLPKLYPEDDTWIFTTSGSTGKPKMVPHSHYSMTSVEADFFVCNIPYDGGMIAYNDRPFSWLAGCISFPIIYRYARVFTDSSTAMSSRSTLEVWNIIKEEKCTHAVLMPYFLSDLIQFKNEYADPYKLDLISTGGQMIDKHFAQVIDVFTKAMISAYGATEVKFVTFYQILKTKNEEVVGDVGTPVEGMEVKIVDERGNITMRGEHGEICIRSAGMFNGYYKDDTLTKQSFLEGNWFRSGDMGYITEDGRVVIQGRSKDIISRGTRKILPAAIEDVIMEMEGVANVVVVPVPDKRLYEEVCLCFTATKDKKIEEIDVQAFCEKQFKIENTADGLGERPAYYLKFECLAKLPSGKPDKRKIRIEAIDRLNIMETNLIT